MKTALITIAELPSFAVHAAPEEFVYQAVELGVLEIDSLGQIWRLLHQQTSRWGGPTVLVPCVRRRAETGRNQPYLQIRVMFFGRRGITTAHRLVYRHFNGVIPAELTINHIDGNKRNNDPNNLELATHKEQTEHAIKVLGWQPITPPKVFLNGESNGQAKLTKKEVVEIINSSEKGVVLADKYSISTANVSRIRNGKLWGHLCV